MLCEPDWLTIPWRIYPKLPKDRLIDILAGLPTLLEETDRRRDCDDEEERHKMQQNLITQFRIRHEELIQWNKIAPVEQFLIITSYQDEKLSAEDLSIVYLMALFFATGLLLYSSLQLSISRGTKLPDNMTPAYYLNKLTLIMKYFFQPSAGRLAMEMVAFPLGLSLQYLSVIPHWEHTEDRAI